MAGPIKISIVGDEKDLVRATDRAEDAMSGAAKTADKAADRIDSSFSSAADGADHMASKSSQAAGALGDLGGVVADGLGFPGLGSAMENAGMWAQGLAGAGDALNLVTESTIVKNIAAKASTLAKAAAEKAAATASKGMAAAQWALNAAMSANPIMLVVLAIAGLVAGLVIAYQKSETFRNIVNAAFGAVMAVVQPVINWFKDAIPAAFGFIVDAVTGYVNLYKTVVTTAFNIVKTIITTVLETVRNVVSGAWGKISGVVSSGVGAIVDAITGIPGKITSLAGRFLDAGKTLMGKIFDGFKAVGSIGADIGRNLFNGVVAGINKAIDAVNGFLPDKIGLPGLPDIDLPNNPIPHIPALAKGGIVTGPTLALIGEAGPEAVVPLNGRYGMGTTYQITVHAPVGSSSADIGRELTKHIDAYERAGGRRRA